MSAVFEGSELRKLLRVALATLVILFAVLSMSTTAHASWYSCNRYDSWTDGYYSVYTDAWGDQSSGGQCLSVNNAGSWTASASYSGNGIKSYPNTSFSLNNAPLSSMAAVNTSFNFSAPGDAAYDFAYDVWSRSGSHNSKYQDDEIMIWEQWNNVGPIAQDQNGNWSYSCAGNPNYACPVATNQYINGAYWNVYRGITDHNVVSFLRTSQRSSGNEDALQFMNWAAQHGMLNTQTLDQVELGVEITSTNGWENFSMNSFSSNVQSYTSGLGGYHTLTPQNATGSRLDINNWGGEGAIAQIWSATGGSNQSFYFADQGGGVYEIQPSYNTALCLDVYNQGTDNQTPVQVWGCWGGGGQKWGVISDGNGIYELAPQNSPDKRLDVTGQKTADGTQVEIYQANGGSNQKWAIR